MKLEGVKDVQFVTPCPKTTEAQNEVKKFQYQFEKNAYIDQHQSHMGVEVHYKDGSIEKGDLGNPNNAVEVYSAIRDWRWNVHSAHMVLVALPLEAGVSGASKMLDGFVNHNLDSFVKGLSEVIPFVGWEIFTFRDWRGRLEAPKMIEGRYSEVIGSSDIPSRLGLVSN